MKLLRLSVGSNLQSRQGKGSKRSYSKLRAGWRNRPLCLDGRMLHGQRYKPIQSSEERSQSVLGSGIPGRPGINPSVDRIKSFSDTFSRLAKRRFLTRITMQISVRIFISNSVQRNRWHQDTLNGAFSKKPFMGEGRLRRQIR
jgi:hypothetical protein